MAKTTKYLILALAVFFSHAAVAEEAGLITTHNVDVHLVPETGAIEYIDDISVEKNLYLNSAWHPGYA